MNSDLNDGLWLSISEIARLKGKSRQAIAKRVALLVARASYTRPGENGTKLVNLAQFDRVVGEVGDAIKEGAAETRAEIEAAEAPASPALRDHQARAAKYAADLKFLDLEERLGRLYRWSRLRKRQRSARRPRCGSSIACQPSRIRWRLPSEKTVRPAPAQNSKRSPANYAAQSQKRMASLLGRPSRWRLRRRISTKQAVAA